MSTKHVCYIFKWLYNIIQSLKKFLIYHLLIMQGDINRHYLQFVVRGACAPDKKGARWTAHPHRTPHRTPIEHSLYKPLRSLCSGVDMFLEYRMPLNGRCAQCLLIPPNILI